MNTKELEALVIAQGAKIDEMQAVINEQAKVIVQAVNFFEIWPTIQAGLEEVHGAMSEMLENQNGMNDTLHGVHTKLEDITAKVEGRNKSAAVKRNMTDADALRVLQGDLIGLGHKEAAEVIGLTYAQVYSCRLGFTFKHVIRDLEKSGWASPWAKG